MELDELISEFIEVYKGNPTVNFEPVDQRFKNITNIPLFSTEVHKELKELLTESYYYYKLQQYSFLFYELVSNCSIELSDSDLQKKLEILKKNVNFVKNCRSYGFQALEEAINRIIVRNEQAVDAAFQDEQFDDIEEFAIYSNTLLTNDIRNYVIFIDQLIINLCPLIEELITLEQSQEFDVVIAFMKLPVIMNFANKFSLRLSLNAYESFFEAFQTVFIEYYERFLLEYLKFGYCNDNFEFFAEQGDYSSSELSALDSSNQLNAINFVEVEAPGCVLYPKLFPYFVNEKIAREIVFIARISKLIRLNLPSSDNIGILDNIIIQELEFNNILTFESEIQKIEKNLSVYIYNNILMENNIHDDLALFLKISLLQNSAVFENFIFNSMEILKNSFNIEETLAFNQVNTKKNFIEKELNQIFNLETGEKFDIFKLEKMPSEEEILTSKTLVNYYTKTPNFYAFDIDAQYFQVDKSQILFNFNYYMQMNTLLSSVIFDYRVKNETSILLISPEIKCSFSRIFRNLLYIKYYEIQMTLSSEKLQNLRKIYSDIFAFSRQNPEFLSFNEQKSNLSQQISCCLKLFRLNQKLLILLNNLELSINNKIEALMAAFKNKENFDFLTLQSSLIDLATGASQAVYLNDPIKSGIICQLFDNIMQFQRLLDESKQFYESKARYGKADEKILLFSQRIDILSNNLNKNEFEFAIQE